MFNGRHNDVVNVLYDFKSRTLFLCRVNYYFHAWNIWICHTWSSLWRNLIAVTLGVWTKKISLVYFISFFISSYERRFFYSLIGSSLNSSWNLGQLVLKRELMKQNGGIFLINWYRIYGLQSFLLLILLNKASCVTWVERIVVVISRNLFEIVNIQYVGSNR